MPALAVAYPGVPLTLLLYWFDEESGSPADATSVQWDLTYGQEIGFGPDVAGPWAYSGATSLTTAQVWHVSTGVYAVQWTPPPDLLPGVYVASWTVGYGGDTFLAFENFPLIAGGPGIPVPAGDIGFWTGSIVNPDNGITIPFGAVDANGIAWLFQSIDGWDSPDVQGAGVVPRAGDHGGIPAPQFYAPRAVTLTVTATAPTQALRDTARALLQAAVPVSALATFTYDEPVPKQAAVRRSGRVTEAYLDLCEVTFTIGLIAPDPRKYGTQVKTAGPVNALPSTLIGWTLPFTLPLSTPAQPPSGSVAVANAGNFETRPLATVTGPITSPAVTNVTTGQTVSWTGLALGAADVLVIDFSAAQGFVNGTYVAADLNSSWWNLPGGDSITPAVSTIQLTGQASAGASMSVTWQDAFE